VDVVLAVSLLVLGLAPIVDAAGLGPTRPLPVTRGPGVLLAVVVTLQAVPLLLRSRRPLAVLMASAAASAASVVLGLPPTAADLAQAAVLYAWVRGARLRGVVAGVAVAFTPVLAALAVPALRAHVGAAAVAGFAVTFVVIPVVAALLLRRRPAVVAEAPLPARAPAAPPAAADRPATLPAVLPGERLTPREREVLGLLADGLSNREIAASLGVSYETAKTHVARVRRKIAARDRTMAAVLADQARREATSSGSA
jgi:DNA-binding CsgD family transcriptional regulator